MRPVEQQTILITGSTDGLGKALARDLASRGATILLHGRSRTRLEEARREIHDATESNRVRPYCGDFSSLDHVRRLAKEVESDHQRLDVLLNNAGLGGGKPGAPRQVSTDG